ncbi:MAG: hypothetical protein JNN03_02705 [Rubrivivax sp.]|nr:hypothetical protein [Rubrivivax sp.]
MNSFALGSRADHPGGTDCRPRLVQALGHVARQLFARERRLTVFAALLLALLVPMAIAAGLDERVLRGANVWIKPMKFALSIALLALTTAWFVGHLQVAHRRGRAVNRIVWLLIGTGSFELGYIALQAALGEGSHYNVGDPLHGIMYSLMGLGALGLTATQPLLAWQLRQHAEPSRAPAYRLAVQVGLWLTFVFGAGVGGVLSSMQPPDASSAAAVPVFGWSLAGGDLRPAHFIGIHAQQLLPLAGWAIAAAGALHARAWVWGVTALYTLLFGAALAWGLVGRLG